MDGFIGGGAKEATEEFDCTDIQRGVFSKRFFFHSITYAKYEADRGKEKDTTLKNAL